MECRFYFTFCLKWIHGGCAISLRSHIPASYLEFFSLASFHELWECNAQTKMGRASLKLDYLFDRNATQLCHQVTFRRWHTVVSVVWTEILLCVLDEITEANENNCIRSLIPVSANDMELNIDSQRCIEKGLARRIISRLTINAIAWTS